MSAGTNLRYITDSLFDGLESHLNTTLGWNDAGRYNKPVQILNEPLDWDVALEPNAVALSLEDIYHEDQEIGSDLTEQRMTFAIDVLAENTAIGTALTGDITAWLLSTYRFPVYNGSEATPSVLFNCDIEGVVQERNRVYENKYAQYLWVISFFVVRSEYASQL